MACGYPHPRFLNEVLTREERLELYAYARLRPIGRAQVEKEHAFDRLTLAQINSAKGKKPKFKDFLLIDPNKSILESDNPDIEKEHQYLGEVFTKLGGKKE